MTGPPIRHTTIVALVALGSVVLCLVASVMALSLRPPQLRNHKDTVAYFLRQRGVSYREITFRQSQEEAVNLRVFNAAVQVHLADGRIVHGWVGCENGDRLCFLVLPGIGIHDGRLPDITPGRTWGWQRWLDDAAAWINTYRDALWRNSR